MPSTYAGNATPPSTTTWAATTSYTAGSSFVQPTPATGQYFQCTVSGTSGSSQPSWTSPLPVSGQTFTDSGATWVCMGSLVAAPTAIAVDIPLDTDPPVTAVIARALKNLANYAKWSSNNSVTPTTGTYTPGTYTPTVSPFNSTSLSGAGAYNILNFSNGTIVAQLFTVLVDLGSGTYTSGTYYQFVVSLPQAFGSAQTFGFATGAGASEMFIAGVVGGNTTTTTVQWTPSVTFTGGGSTLGVFDILVIGH
jgi:hypothetical protein